jgi:biopolymer transport protein ExbD
LSGHFKRLILLIKFQLQVEAHENLKYGRLAEVMAIAQGAGVTKLGFVTVSGQKWAPVHRFV